MARLDDAVHRQDSFVGGIPPPDTAVLNTYNDHSQHQHQCDDYTRQEYYIAHVWCEEELGPTT